MDLEVWGGRGRTGARAHSKELGILWEGKPFRSQEDGQTEHGKLSLTESMARGGKMGVEGNEGTLAMVYSPNRKHCSHSLRGCAGDLTFQADALRWSYVPPLYVARKTSRCFLLQTVF